ncbi:MAG: LLM class flavin-dependent oxidoreductase [Ignavibacteria bacterium]|jgi:probable LLM family oxidoreductase|nr:LLM class flavin-dependent oxidoreductase [Ignavibacteria bacterium]MDH7528325.1 LLM class flavin-dependent oxidoreductase [Ignavibacteria bacterium]NPV12515.1 LLM class flavin-dependent oxidoreductase [Ignavibacteria bacterium]
MELGIYSFGDRTIDFTTGELISEAERYRRLLEEIKLADEVGLDVFGIGEHHRPDYIISSPIVVLSAAASITKKIRLTSAVNVLSSDDPVRLFQQFATLDLISNGRAEIMVGRGSFIESFPLFGYDLQDYEELFEEKLQMLLHIRENTIVNWKGNFTQTILNRGVYPRPLQNPLPVWIAMGGTPESAIRAAKYGLPLAIAIIGGLPERFKYFADLYRSTAEKLGHKTKLSINSHGFIAETSQEAINLSFPAVKFQMDRIGRERGWSPMTKEQYEFSATLRGANFVGSPDQIIEKILFQYEIFQHDRFLIQFTVGTLPHNKVLKSIELFGDRVAPVVRKEIKKLKKIEDKVT